MSDDFESLEQVESINAIGISDFEEFLKTVHADGKCSSCGGDHCWGVRHLADRPVLLEAPFYDTSGQSDVFLSTLCEKCGNTRLYNALYVARFLHKWRSHNHGGQ